MTLYLVAGAGASTAATSALVSPGHLPSPRTRRYPSDTTDAEWVLLAPLVPAGGPGPRGGRPPVHSRRDIGMVFGCRVVPATAWRDGRPGTSRRRASVARTARGQRRAPRRGPVAGALSLARGRGSGREVSTSF